MSTLDADLLARGQALADDLRREGRDQDAAVLLSLLTVAERRINTAHFLTTGQVASRLGVSRQTVVNWIKRGVIPGTRMGGRLVVPISVMERFAPIEQLLDALDQERLPLMPDEASAVVANGREHFKWGDQEA